MSLMVIVPMLPAYLLLLALYAARVLGGALHLLAVVALTLSAWFSDDFRPHGIGTASWILLCTAFAVASVPVFRLAWMEGYGTLIDELQRWIGLRRNAFPSATLMGSPHECFSQEELSCGYFLWRRKKNSSRDVRCAYLDENLLHRMRRTMYTRIKSDELVTRRGANARMSCDA